MKSVMASNTNKLPSRFSKISTKSKSAFYMITPLGDLEAPHWRWIETMPDGSSVIVLALRLRDMAAKINQGGMLVHLTGAPMSLADIAGILGYQLLRVQYGVTILNRQGIMDGEDRDGWRIIDPVLRQHFNRLLPASLIDQIRPSLQLDAEPTTESKDDRKKRLARNRKAKFDYRGRWGKDPDEIVYVNKGVTECVTDSVTDKSNYEVTQVDHLIDIEEDLPVTDYNKKTNKTAADYRIAAVSPSSTPTKHEPDLEIEEAINSLPAEYRLDAAQVAIEEVEFGPQVIASNISLLASRLLASKPKQISNPGGWLRKAIKGNYAGNERENQIAELETKKQYAIRQQKQTEAIERDRRTELMWQAKLLQEFEALSEIERKEIEAEAIEINMKNTGTNMPEMIRAAVLNIVELRCRLKK